MAKAAAASFCSELFVRHPLVHRTGVSKLTRRLVRHGVAPEDATQLTLALWGMERLQVGACFQELLDQLRRAGVEDSLAIPACFEARRLLLETNEGAPVIDPELQLARWCVAFLGTLLLVGVLLELGAR
jgi:hypothetical protein